MSNPDRARGQGYCVARPAVEKSFWSSARTQTHRNKKRDDASASRYACDSIRHERKSGDSYTIDHSAQAYVIDPQGRLRLLVRHDRIREDLADDLRTLLR